MVQSSNMEEWSISDDEVLVDYGEFTEEEIKEMNKYVTISISNAESESVLADPTFHDSGLSPDHGRIATTAPMGLEGW